VDTEEQVGLKATEEVKVMREVGSKTGGKGEGEKGAAGCNFAAAAGGLILLLGYGGTLGWLLILDNLLVEQPASMPRG